MLASNKICPLLYTANTTKYSDKNVAKGLSKCKEGDCMWYISPQDYNTNFSNCAIVRIALAQ